MENENNLQPDTGIQEQQVEQVQEQESHTPEQPDQLAENQRVEDNRERNFAALREARERAERERDEAIRYIQQMQQQQQPAQEQDNVNWESDDLVEAKQVNRQIKKLENQLRQYEQQTAYQVTEARIKSQFNDFDQVVTKENIDALRTAYPEIAQSLHATPDIYNKAVSTYNIIKKFGIHNPNVPTYEKVAAQKNAAKPRPTNTVSPQQGDTPLNKANEFANGFLTEDRKSQLYKEMMEARNNY